MGDIVHHAILVSASYDTNGEHWIEVARRAALEAGCRPTAIQEGVVNDVRSFAILPDGSKEGWEESNAGDRARYDFIRWMNDQAYEDGSSPLSWVEVEWDNPNFLPRVMRGSGRGF